MNTPVRQKDFPEELSPLSRESLHTLKILDEVSKGNQLTQRALSKKLGIALGMTNNYLKRLAHQGYIQIVQKERKRLQYLLTPRGIAEKSALTYQYIKRSYQFFTDVKERTRQFFSVLEGQGVRTMIIYKATVITEIAVLVLQDTAIRLVGILDEDPQRESFLGYSIILPEDLEKTSYDRILVTTEESFEEVAGRFKKYGVTEDQLCSMI